MLLRRFSGVEVLLAGLLLLSCLVTALLLAQAGDAAGPEQGPVAAYSFDEGTGTTVSDTTGHGHTATIEGAKWARGRYGDGLEFKGSEHNVVKVPASSELNFEEEFTLEAWVRPASSTDKLAPIVGKTTGGGSGSKSLSYYLYAGNSESKPYGEVQHVLGTGKKATATTAPPGATWTHLALTYDGAVERLFVNGVQVAETATEAPVTTSGELQIGAETEHSEYFSGRIDEVRIYNRVLNGAEVGADMETPIVTPKATPVAAYSFDEGTGTTVEDVTGHGHTATIEGAKWARGRYGGGLEFKGSEHNVVKVPASSELNFEEEFTLEAWVRPASSTDKLAPILGKTTGGGSGSKSLSYYLYAGNSESKPYGEIQHTLGTGKKATASSAPPGATWTHLALTYDGAKERLFVNGIQAAEAATEAPVTTTGELQIGAETEHGEYFSGRIDEVRIYNRVLNGAEVGADMETPIVTPKATPVAAYSFDEGTGTTVEDVTGDGHTGTIEGAEWTKGRYGGALNFESASACVSVPDSPELRLSEEFTLEAWVRPVGGIYEDPVVVRESGGKPAFGLGIGDHVEGEPEGFIGTGKGSEVAFGGGAVQENEWTPVATTYDGGRIRVYEDGELVAEQTAPTPPVTGEGPLKIGCDTPDGPFTGKIDEVRVYNRALDGAEVDADAEAPIQTPKATPVAAYSFDEGEGATVEDVTGDGHTATIEGAQWTSHGRYGGAIEFDAAEEDVLKVPASPELDFGEEFTLEAWVRPSGGPNKEAPLIDKQEGGDLGYFLYEGGSVSDRPEAAASEEQEFVHADEPLPARAWSHVALTFTGNRTYLYVDGELVDNGAAAPTVTSEGELEIGGSTDTSDYFDGRIDEVRVYNRALNEAEVGSDMEAPIQTPKQAPVAAWSFDEGEGTVAEDVTGDGHTATIHGAKWSTHGRYGGAMEFAEGDWLSVPASPELDLTEEFTLEAWIHPETKHEFDDILSKETAEEPSRFAYLVADHHGQFATYFGEYPENAHYSPGEEIKPHTWTHVAVVDGGGRIHLYIDGEEVESGPAPSVISTDGELRIGSNRFLESHNDFIGRIDEVRIYDRALSDAEVAADERMPLGLREPPVPFGIFPFDDGSGGTAENQMGGEPATLNEAEWIGEGKFGGAVRFSSKGSRVTIPNTNLLTGGMTADFWVKPESSLGSAPVFAIESPTGSNNEYELNLPEDRKLVFAVRGPKGGLRTITAPEPISNGTWTNVAISASGRSIRLYVAGALVAQEASPPLPQAGPAIYVGGLPSEAHLKGAIDELRLYGSALSPKEVLRDASGPGPEIELSGDALGQIEEDSAREYELHIASRPSGSEESEPELHDVSVSVDGQVVKSYQPECVTVTCEFQGTWNYDPRSYLGSRHQVRVMARTLGGAVSFRSFWEETAANSLRECNAYGIGKAATVKAEALSGGGTRYTYSAGEGGAIAERVYPPMSFNPTTASEKELEEYNWPPRPSSSQALTEWKEEAAAYVWRVPSAPNPCQGDRATQALDVQSELERSQIYSGYVQEDLKASQFVEARARYRQPASHPNAEDCDGKSAVATWVGLGGGPLGTGLIQVGTEINEANQIRAFWEYTNVDRESHGEVAEREDMPINSMDILDARVRFYPKAEVMSFRLYDHRTGMAWGPVLRDVRNATARYYDGTSATYMDERPFAPSIHTTRQLKDFRLTEWFGPEATKANGEEGYLGENPHQRRYMALYPRQPRYAEPSGLQNSGRRFRDSWLNCKVPNESSTGGKSG